MRISHTFGSSLRLLGPLEERMLEALWKKGSATVREIADDDFKDLAYSTIMTTVDRLYKKGLLTRSEGRSFRYTPRFSREDLHREAAEQALRVLLDANPASPLPLSFMVEVVGERDVQLLDDLSKLVARKRREISKRDPGRKETK
jgi:BlaI family transcriptional regulator, penicillinase repressor